MAPAWHMGVTAKETKGQVLFSPSFTLSRQGKTAQPILCLWR